MFGKPDREQRRQKAHRIFTADITPAERKKRRARNKRARVSRKLNRK